MKIKDVFRAFDPDKCVDRKVTDLMAAGKWSEAERQFVENLNNSTKTQLKVIAVAFFVLFGLSLMLVTLFPGVCREIFK